MMLPCANRGSLTVWFTEEAIAALGAQNPGPRGVVNPTIRTGDHDGADRCAPCFRLALRQTEGLIGSVIRLLGLDLAIP